MASGYDKVRDDLITKIFGKAIPFDQLTREQGAKLKEALTPAIQDAVRQGKISAGDIPALMVQLGNEFNTAQDRWGAQSDAKTENIVGRIQGEAAGTRDELNRFVDQNVIPELENVRGAKLGAINANAEALRLLGTAGENAKGSYSELAKQAAENALKYNTQSEAAQAKLSGAFQGLDASDRAALSKFGAETDPLMRQLQAGDYGADVAADPEGLAAQRGALQAALGDVQGGGGDQMDVVSKYKALTSPEVTGQERYLAEIARRNFEAQDRGNREAVMQDLSQRGLNSGTLQIANNLAAQERLGQERTLAELGLQSNAVGRSMQALEGYAGGANSLRGGNQAANQIYGGQAGALRNANDAINMFNKEQSQISQRFQNQYAQDEARRVGDLAGERQTATRTTNEGIGRRASDESTQAQMALRDQSGRDTEARGEAWTATDKGYDIDRGYAGEVADTGQRNLGNAATVAGVAQGMAGTFGTTRRQGSQDVIEADKLEMGEEAVQRALGMV